MLDLNLVRVFVVIYETGSVSAAAARLHISQPSVSYNLKRLRDLLGEPLFRRTRTGMTPTFFATQLYERFRRSVTEIETTIETTRNFDPFTSTRRFRIAMSDIGEIFFLPRILETLERIAPNIELDVTTIDINRLEVWLSTGKIDAAISNRGGLPVDAMAEVLFVERYVGLASDRHPRLGGTVTMQDYLAERHVTVAPETGHNLVDERLQELGVIRRVGLHVSHFSVLPEVIARTDLVLTLPSRMAALFASRHAVRAFDLPFAVRDLDVMLRWQQHSTDPVAQRWLSQTMRSCLSD